MWGLKQVDILSCISPAPSLVPTPEPDLKGKGYAEYPITLFTSSCVSLSPPAVRIHSTFFKDFIYLFMRDRERERKRQ